MLQSGKMILDVVQQVQRPGVDGGNGDGGGDSGGGGGGGGDGSDKNCNIWQ